MIPIADLRDKHAGRAGVVLGGGPSLAGDLARLRGDCLPLRVCSAIGLRPRNDKERMVLIAVNHHVLESIPADYLVFMDTPERNLTFIQMVNDFCCGTRVSPIQGYSDVDLSGMDWWRGSFSSHLATWLACWMGCDPVLLCGMDLYQNPIPPGEDPRNMAYQTPLEEHLEGWREAFEKCIHPERIRAMSGPLVEVFGRWR